MNDALEREKSIKDESVLINKKITNTNNDFKSLYIIGVLFAALSLGTTYLFFTYYFKYTNAQQKNSFIEGNHQGVTKLIIKDLEVIFDESQSLYNLFILTNYTEINNIEGNSNVIGNILYIKRAEKSLIFDLSQLNILLTKVLGEDFYYKISLNDQLLVTNSNNKLLSSSSNYKMIDNQTVTLDLELKDTSNFITSNQVIIQKQSKLLIILHVIVFLCASVFIVYKIKLWKKAQYWKKKVQSLELIHNQNILYLTECNNLLGKDKLPIFVPNSKNIDNTINVYELIKEIQVITEFYTTQYFYKYSLDITAEHDLLNLPTNSIVFKQLIISLVYNLLYFMRGGTHIKQFIINILDNRITMQYDSFAAKEEHMCNWSNGIFEHLGNPYILDCKKIFEQMKRCNLEYQIDACQGKNKIIINFKEKDANNKIIQFKQNI